MISKYLNHNFSFLSTPFAVEIDNSAEEIEMEWVALQYDTILKQKYIDVGSSDSY